MHGLEWQSDFGDKSWVLWSLSAIACLSSSAGSMWRHIMCVDNGVTYKLAIYKQHGNKAEPQVDNVLLLPANCGQSVIGPILPLRPQETLPPWPLSFCTAIRMTEDCVSYQWKTIRLPWLKNWVLPRTPLPHRIRFETWCAQSLQSSLQLPLEHAFLNFPCG